MFRRPSAPTAFPLADPRCRLYGWGRQALSAGLRALALGPGDEVLVPAYHHGSEVEALTRAGIACRFYEATESLAPEETELERLLGPRTRALFLVHYLGFPQDAPRWRAWCDARGLLLLEDAAQAWLATTPEGPVGSFGDLAIFCLYKAVGLPEGGAVVSVPPAADPGVDPRLGLTALARRQAAWLTGRSRLAGGAAAALVRRRSDDYDPIRDFALREHGDTIWRSVPFLLQRIELDRVATRRRANYRALLEALGDHAPAPFDRLPDGASPFAFPLTTQRKQEVLERLASHSVRALDFWSTAHPGVGENGFAGADRRRATTVCLPVHQELRQSDLERIVDAAGDALS